MAATRDNSGRFLTSGNPSGRPRGAAGIARRILEATNEGGDLVQWALDTWRDVKRSHAERAAMHAWLADRALGKALATSEVTMHSGDTPSSVDWSSIPLEKRQEMLATLRDARRQGSADGSPVAVPTSDAANTAEAPRDFAAANGLENSRAV